MAGFRTTIDRIIQEWFHLSILLLLSAIFIVHFTSSAMLGDSTKSDTTCVTFQQLSAPKKVHSTKTHDTKRLQTLTFLRLVHGYKKKGKPGEEHTSP